LRTRRISVSLRAHTIYKFNRKAQAADRIWLITGGNESQLMLTMACIKLLIATFGRVQLVWGQCGDSH